MHTTQPKANHSLAIALVVSAILLVAAGGVAWWMVSQKIAPQAAVEHKDPNDTSVVKTVSWVAPATLPANFTKRDQNTTSADMTYYTDTANACAITTTVSKNATASAKDTVLQAAAASESTGIKTVTTTDGPGYDMKDVDGTHAYGFGSVQLVQSVDFTEQQNVIAFKKFGLQVASISIACKTPSWAAQKSTLQTLLTQFMVKTER